MATEQRPTPVEIAIEGEFKNLPTIADLMECGYSYDESRLKRADFVLAHRLRWSLFSHD